MTADRITVSRSKRGTTVKATGRAAQAMFDTLTAKAGGPSDAELEAMALRFTHIEPLSDFDYIGFARAAIAAAALQAMAERDRLQAILNTPELVDFPKAVHLEACHQEVRWGTGDREGKQPQDGFWLLGHLAGRALEHHKEAERIRRSWGVDEPNEAHRATIAHHREKAVHHCITAAAALSHWHASVLGKHTAMRAGSAAAIKQAKELP